ncbi:hypothetical protein KKG22_00890 [Patescibacteria group bacterium]|nr:hypothetical protein [Patescibacteria group bacterium]MBU1721991.1 hypothetical protein [Patescibacteria group bacterium]MBU1901259.1 hypothetical protein [Patescibacteria group bacterium]
MNIKYDDVVKLLVKKFPQFNFDEDDSDLPYIVAGDFARYLLKCFESKSFGELERGLNFIEELHLVIDQKTIELAKIGFIEGIQNVWKEKDSEKVYDFLGEESKKSWEQISKFWENVGSTVAPQP